MEVSFEFDAEARSEKGTRPARRLRRAHKIPAVLYGAGEEPQTLALAENQVVKNLRNEAVFSHILTLKIAGSKRTEQAIIKQVHRHPSKGTFLHLDFQRIKADEEIRMNVPIHLIGEEVAAGIKKGGILLRNMVETEISCLPKDLPEYLEADVTSLEIGDALHLSEIKVPEGVQLLELDLEEGIDPVVVTIQAPISEEELEASLGEEEMPEEIGGEEKGAEESEESGEG